MCSVCTVCCCGSPRSRTRYASTSRSSRDATWRTTTAVLAFALPEPRISVNDLSRSRHLAPRSISSRSTYAGAVSVVLVDGALFPRARPLRSSLAAVLLLLLDSPRWSIAHPLATLLWQAERRAPLAKSRAETLFCRRAFIFAPFLARPLSPVISLI